MLLQLALGSVLISVTLALQALIIGIVIQVMTRLGSWLIQPPLFQKTVLTLIASVLWLVLGISASTWLWAWAFIILGAFQSMELALYFSIVTFTTLGYGDITLNEPWRLLASMAAVNGLIVFGLNTAFLVELFSELRKAQEPTAKSRDEKE